jgi:hypothetical protein
MSIYATYVGLIGTGITYRSSMESFNASSNSIVVSKPPDTVDGDVMLALVYINDVTATITPPAGWTVIDTINTTISAVMATYYKVASSEGASYTWSFDKTQRNRASISSFIGVNKTNMINQHGVQGNAASTGCIAPSITTTTGNCMIVFMGAVDDSAVGTFTAATGMTEVLDSSGVAPHEHAYVIQVSAGVSGTKTAVLSTALLNAGFLIALTPSFIKTVQGLILESIKTINGLIIGNVKNVNQLNN